MLKTLEHVWEPGFVRWVMTLPNDTNNWRLTELKRSIVFHYSDKRFRADETRYKEEKRQEQIEDIAAIVARLRMENPQLYETQGPATLQVPSQEKHSNEES
jgi:hypothetical protein